MAQKNAVLYLFDRPLEPVFMPKGDNEKGVVFDVTADGLADRYKPIASQIINRFGEDADHISVQRITLPDLSIPMQIGRREQFSLFIPKHRRIAAHLITIYLGMRTESDFMSAAVYTRDVLNPYLYNYALSVAILHRPDTRNLPIPPLHEVFPEKYMDSRVLGRLKEELNIVDAGSRVPLVIPQDYTASNLEVEHRLAYFREDPGLNLHHWHWHLVYPFNGPASIVNKDRRGELFYYLHQQIMGRYNFERFCNNLSRTKRLINWREPIEEGYFPKLDSLVSSRVWPPRHANARLSDVYRELDQLKFDLQDLERWRDRIYEAIHKGEVVTDRGQTRELDIDTLGNMVEASVLTPNSNLYGDIHNLGHVAIGLCHDPDGRHLETFGVIGDSATAMRDPAFYRWHAFVDDMFQEHKNTLPRYTREQIDYPGVRVTSVEIEVRGGRTKNELQTFWQQSDVDMSRGLDFQPRGSILARFTHLQHSPFSYKIQVENSNNSNKIGTVRIYLAPKFDERGLPMLFTDQKGLFIELDKFQVTLKPKSNTITRRSDESSVTIPFEQTFRNLEKNRPADTDSSIMAFNFCGCGWPHHLLIPKGSEQGFPCQLFVMVSNYDGDKIDQTMEGQCSDASSYCGIRDKLYPDKRSMGYPFDRQPRDNVSTLQEFVTPNMVVQDVTIRFTGRTVAPRSDASNTLN
ncbi:phenoloxidase 1-like [Bacillus rossius redtenbacheri]|uniref:phenoloxidase 1-like n=1 Tax=Bacillus rossius redtenbacheri TaxID=93214 RepID=UPI002FDCB15A